MRHSKSDCPMSGICQCLVWVIRDWVESATKRDHVRYAPKADKSPHPPVLTPPPASRQPHCELGEIAYFALDRDGTTVLQGYDLVAY